MARLAISQHSRLRLASEESVVDGVTGRTVTFWGREEIREVPVSPGDEWHEVQAGDRLYRLSQKWYGTPYLDWIIADANGIGLEHTELLPGRMLRIPGRDTIARMTR